MEISQLKNQLADLNEGNFEESITFQQISFNYGSFSVNGEDEFRRINTVSKFNEHEYSKNSDMTYLNKIKEGKDNLIDELKDKIIILKKYAKLIENSENIRITNMTNQPRR